ncbi:response regulator transcription factor [Methylobacterium nodulans]|uniref:Two component transcriptional regulator, LuxR family n=1 Tax=Methylobacterium nodulans (strain LMG 21967 / CNCM I-2342 / ORS 2060) TaxID=460265 RepID=B8IQC8_METNO|nr:response regulator transcription factor [Methylobacterium nodulans]ACL60440.1 two component transcriptional regulator, LuxR family [Methylobacterium nodulans ORS 2060]
MMNGQQGSLNPRGHASHDGLETVIIGGTELLREGLRRLLIPKGFEVTTVEHRIADAARTGGTPNPPAIVILCAEPKVELSLDEVRAVRERYPHSVLICLCSTSNEDQIVPMLENGAAAILTQTTGVNTLIQAVELALMGHRVVPCLPTPPTDMPTQETEEQAQAGSDPVLTMQSFRPSPREVMIIACLVRGESNRDIARQLSIPVGRVKGHVKAILRKMRVQNRTQAAIWGMKHRLGSESPLAAEEPCLNGAEPAIGLLPQAGLASVSAVAAADVHPANVIRSDFTP